MSSWADELHDPILTDGYGPLAACDQQPHPAEACTELGADSRAARPSLMSRVLTHPITRLRLAWLQWQLACLRHEQRLYVETGRAGPVFERECRRQQLDLLRRIRPLEETAHARP